MENAQGGTKHIPDSIFSVEACSVRLTQAVTPGTPQLPKDTHRLREVMFLLGNK